MPTEHFSIQCACADVTGVDISISKNAEVRLQGDRGTVCHQVEETQKEI